jgi:hypothetical protein
MSRSLFAALAAAFLLSSPFSWEANGDVPASLVDGCWPGITWDELGIRDAIKAD